MDNVPEEMLSRILQCLASGELGVVTRVKKKFSRIATSLLYSECDLADSAVRDQHRSVNALLRTLLARPDLRPLIRTFRIGDWPSCGRGDYDEISMTEVSDISQCMPSLRSCPYEYQRDFGVALLDARQDAVAAAILSMLPNLKSITFDKNALNWPDAFKQGFYDDDHSNELILRLIRLSSTPSLAASGLFRGVSFLSIGGGLKEAASWRVGAIFLCLRLPALKTFIAGGFSCIQEGAGWDGECGYSTAVNVTLHDCAIETHLIKKVLSACKALERFKCFRVCKYHTTQTAEPDYSYGGLHLDLLHHRESLRCLHMHSKSCGHENSWDSDPINSLADLEHLELLEADEDFLFGGNSVNEDALASILPPNLKRTIIKGEEHESQREVFREIRRTLLSGRMHAVFEVQNGRVKDAIKVMKKTPEIKVEEVTDRYEVDSHSICSFIVYKADDETTAGREGARSEW